MSLLHLFALALLFLFNNHFQEEDPGALAGFDKSDTSAVSDGDELDPSNPLFKRLLYRTGTVDGEVLSQWSARTKDISLDQFSQLPVRYRFYPTSISGEAMKVERFDFSAEDAKDFFRGFFIVRCKANDDTEFIVISRSTVSSWPANQLLDTPQPITANGFFFGRFSIGSPPAVPIFVARRFSWFPTAESETLNVNSSSLALSKSGVDIALLDTVRARKGQAIGIRESNCFWQMLSATRSINLADAIRVDFVSMLGTPVKNVGNAASIQGRIRQCTPVKVTEDKVETLLGADTWYQLTIFPDLKGRPIKVATKDGGPEVYSNAFPVTICMLKLPEGEDRESIIGKNYFFDGVFYRIWSYPSERTEDTSLAGQPSPLIMATSATLVRSSKGQLEVFLYALVCAVLIATGAVVWFVFNSRGASTRAPLPEKLKEW